MTNIGTSDFRLIICMAPFIDEQIKQYLYGLQADYPHLMSLMPEQNPYWADFINDAINRASGCKYFIKSHDDIELLTPNFLTKVQGILEDINEPVGWVSFTDKDYLNGHWAPSTRPGFHTDHIFENGCEKRTLFQFHSLPYGWWKPSWPVVVPLCRFENKVRSKLHLKQRMLPKRCRDYYVNLPYDFPDAPVKCHSPFNHFVLIEMDTIKQIGQCENWGTYNALLVDEDWGLRTLQLGFNNIWIPEIEYVHYRNGATRSWYQIAKHQNRVHDHFFKKWGFNSEGKAEELNFIERKYKGTNIPWSIGRRSYEWEYIK